MNEQQIEQLKALPFPVFYYCGMDEDLQLTSVDVDYVSPLGASYVLTYSNGMGGKVQICGCNGGVGDIMPGERQVNFSNILYGKGTAEIYPADSAEGVSFKAQWIRTWRPGAYYSFSGKAMADRFIKKIVDGLLELE
ncbi:MAG: hypothetical protein ACI376_02525 [Candidatus Bruticola sp.]